MLFLLLLLSLFSLTFADPTPVVIWHGMGDSWDSRESMKPIIKDIEAQIPGVYVYSVALANTQIEDKEKTFFANMNDEIVSVCAKLQADPKLANGYNAIGFSQGGQFLRAIIQRCPTPQMKVLMTLGGQHQGVYGFPKCIGDTPLCDEARELMDKGAYISYVQDTLVQAQYYHDSDDEETYRTKSIFIADINNELTQNDEYKKNLAGLEQLVLVMFAQDTVVVPRNSSWFGFYEENNIDVIVPYNETTLYTQDRIGLKTLDESGRLQFYSMDGDHMQIDMNFFNQLLQKYFV